jgi:hypothetical protein
MIGWSRGCSTIPIPIAAPIAEVYDIKHNNREISLLSL